MDINNNLKDKAELPRKTSALTKLAIVRLAKKKALEAQQVRMEAGENDNNKLYKILLRILLTFVELAVFGLIVGLTIVYSHKHIRKITAENENKIIATLKADLIRADSIIASMKELEYINKDEEEKSKMKIASTLIKGIDKYITIKNDDELSLLYDINPTEKWFFINKEDQPKYYEIWFEKSPLGRQHALSKIIELCNINGKDFNKPDMEDSIIKAWDIKGFRFSIGKDSGIRACIMLSYPGIPNRIRGK